MVIIFISGAVHYMGCGWNTATRVNCPASYQDHQNMIPSDIIWHVAEILQQGDQFWIHQLWNVSGILHLGNMSGDGYSIKSCDENSVNCTATGETATFYPLVWIKPAHQMGKLCTSVNGYKWTLPYCQIMRIVKRHSGCSSYQCSKSWHHHDHVGVTSTVWIQNCLNKPK